MEETVALASSAAFDSIADEVAEKEKVRACKKCYAVVGQPSDTFEKAYWKTSSARYSEWAYWKASSARYSMCYQSVA